MTETQEPAAPETRQQVQITFKGREIWAQLPRPEQILVWQRTAKQLGEADPEGWNGTQVLNALERARKIIDSVLVSRSDIDWLDDQMLEGGLGLLDCGEIITLVIEQVAAQNEEEPPNRAAKRAAKKTPAKRAARKAN